MQLLVDFFPLLAFFAAYKLGGIYAATATLIVASALQIGLHWKRTGRVKTLHWVTAALVLVFGGATLIFHDPRFIQLKPSVLTGLLAVAFLLSQFFGAKPLSQRFLESILQSATDEMAKSGAPGVAGTVGGNARTPDSGTVSAPQASANLDAGATGKAVASTVGPANGYGVSRATWSLLNLTWVAFFALEAWANLYVAQHFSEQTWVYFKVGGLTVLLLLFIVPQVLWLMSKETVSGQHQRSPT